MYEMLGNWLVQSFRSIATAGFSEPHYTYISSVAKVMSIFAKSFSHPSYLYQNRGHRDKALYDLVRSPLHFLSLEIIAADVFCIVRHSTAVALIPLIAMSAYPGSSLGVSSNALVGCQKVVTLFSCCAGITCTCSAVRQG